MSKVVMLVPSLEDKGPVIVAKDIALYDNKNEFIFISLRKNKAETLKKYINFKVYELGLGKFPLISLKLKKLVEKINPNIIHCHCFWPTILAGIYLKKFRIISTLHNNPLYDFYYEYGKITSILMIKMMLFFQKNFYKNIAISNYIKEVYESLNLTNVETIYNGIPQIEIKKKTIKEVKKEKKIKLVTVSVLNRVKNVSFLLKVIEHLKNEEKNIELKIIGDGIEKSKLEKLVKEKNLQKEILFLGKLKRERVYEELQKSDIFLFSSLNEGFGLAVVEALLFNIPVIVSDIPVMKEIIKNNKNGIICNLSIEEYKNAVLKIYMNLDEFKENTKRYFNKDFLAQNMSKNYAKIYEEKQ